MSICLLIALLGPLGAAQVEAAGLNMFPECPPPARRIVVSDLGGASLDQRLALHTLQGLVNREGEAELYLLAADWDERWLRHLHDLGAIEAVEEVPREQLLDRYRESYRTVVHYDPRVPATINVATMVASLEDGVVVGPESGPVPTEGKRTVDLRGRWDSNAEAYRWALNDLWPRMSHRVLAAYHPLGTSHMLRDYLVAHRVFTIWVTSEEKADGVVSDYGSERAVFEDLMGASPANIPLIGFVTSGLDHGLTEYAGVGLAGQYGKLSVVSNFMSNASLLSGVDADLAGSIERYWAKPRRPCPKLDRSKVYLALCIVESGDAPAYWQFRQHEVWDDPLQGRVAINWSVGPAVLELLPPIFQYFVDRATPLDHFYTAISGAGYVHPFRDFMAQTADPEAAWDDYLELTNRSMRALGSTSLGLYTDAWRTFDRGAADPVTRRFAEGLPMVDVLVMGMGRDDGLTEDTAMYVLPGTDVLVTHILSRWPHDHGTRSRAENIAWLVEDIRSQTPEDRPAFMSVMALSWSHDAGSLREVLDRLGPDYVPVLLPELRELWESR